MREDIADESVDLIYLDPPFNSKRLYNAFIGNAQWVAFNDTWHWSEAVDDFHEVASDVKMANTMEGLRLIHGEGAELAYLSYMANRLSECWRVLKPTGSLYLHCDPTMSHSLKLILDGRFGKSNILNEIIWFYKKWTNTAKFFQRNHDVIHTYAKNFGEHKFNKQFSDDISYHYEKGFHTNVVEGGIRQLIVYDEEKATRKVLEKKYDRIVYQLDRKKVALPDVWEIPIINPMAKERIGYPTQKPLVLLERIIKASSNEGDIVFDPFCGCGTTIHAAQNLNRQWIGIDICVNACKVIQERLEGSFDSVWSDVEFIGLPRTRDHAKTLFSLDAFKFEKWAASLVDGMEANKKQVGDKGIDGRGRIAIKKGRFIDIVSQVKGGKTQPKDVQAFNGARKQAGADLGIFTCFEDKVTQGMKDTAASTGRFMEVPRVQIYTIEDYFEGRKPDMPSKFKVA